MTYPAARARQLTALEAHKVRASPPRVYSSTSVGGEKRSAKRRAVTSEEGRSVAMSRKIRYFARAVIIHVIK